MNDQTDQQLLRNYTTHRSEAAFAELVRRHVDLVHSAAHRMVGDPHLARDITQATFVALAQHAAQLTDRPALSGWLHTTARNLAVKTIRTDVRRRVREQEAVVMNELLSSAPDVPWEQIAPHLDAALGELGEPERDAVLLRYFEMKSAAEIGGTLGISAEAAQKRVSRAVEHMREFFAKRGVTVGASGLVVVISANAVQAAPLGLALAITTAAGLTSATLATTATITAKTIAMTTLQKTLVATTVTVLAGAGIYQTRQASQLRDQVQTLQQQQAPLVEQIQLLQAERDDATNRLTDLLAENSSLKSNPHESELLRLRGQVGVLKQQLAMQHSSRPTSQQPAAASGSFDGDIPGQLADAIAQGDPLALTKLGDFTKSQADFYRTNSVGLQGDEHAAAWEKSFRGVVSAFDKLSDDAVKGNANARQAIMQSTRMDALRSFAVDSLGKLAGNGDDAALELLLNPAQNALLLSGTIPALKPAADAGNQRAIDTLASIMGDEKKKSLWLIASQGLQNSAAAGNATAINALKLLPPDFNK